MRSVLILLCDNEPETEQDCELKFHSPLPKLKNTLEISKA